MAVAKLTKEQVLTIAKLVKLELSDTEVEKFEISIPQTLDIIDVLKELDTTGTLPTSQITGLSNVFQKDEPSVTLSQEAALSNASQKDRGLFVTKAVFDRT